MTDNPNPGIVCPECLGDLVSKDKERKGKTLRHTYHCLNENCPARKRGEMRMVYTVERLWFSRCRANNSNNRVKRTKTPAINQITLPNT